ncbi:MAG: hypothetical protein AABX98_06725, partial [Nanoarchaeota archaeon]
SSEDVLLVAPAVSTPAEKNIDAWYTNALRSTQKPIFQIDSEGDTSAFVSREGSLLQFFRILDPGDEYSLTFDMDISSLGEKNGLAQKFYTSLSFYDSSFTLLNFSMY